jgi:hypothetical protein
MIVRADVVKLLGQAAGGLSPRGRLAVSYAYTICLGEGGCDARAALWATIALLRGDIPASTPPGLTSTLLQVLEEARDAAVQPPRTLLARIALDAEALSHAGIAALVAAAPPNSLEEMLRLMADALSYAVSLDSILYTRTARQLARKLAPHTIAAARWLVEEAALHGVKLAYRAEAVYEGRIAYLDLESCPDGRRPVKEAVVKPHASCVEYRVVYRCCSEEITVPICVPESTRAT